MRMRTFIDTYCTDIVEKVQERNKLLAEDDFPFDAVLHDENGNPYKVVYTSDGKDVAVHEILGNTREDYMRVHPTDTELELYDNYIEGLIILEGEEALFHIRNELQREFNRLEMYTDILEI